MYSNDQFTWDLIRLRVLNQLVAIFFLITFCCLLTLLGNLLAQNQKRTEEFQSLLNWIQNGALIQNLEKVIRFANKSSRRLLKAFHQIDEDVTWEDTTQKIFRKVEFNPNGESNRQQPSREATSL